MTHVDMGLLHGGPLMGEPTFGVAHEAMASTLLTSRSQAMVYNL